MGAANILGSLGQATPFGAAASVASQVIGSPLTSRSGDINTGAASFGGISKGGAVPSWVFPAAFAFVGVAMLIYFARK
jgi:hypothetical protein